MPQKLDESPAARVIRKCGGIDETAKLVKRHRSVVNRWLLSREQGGTGGIVPAHHQQVLLTKTARRADPLTPEDFFELTAASPAPTGRLAAVSR